jgi:hypothetical protein
MVLGRRSDVLAWNRLGHSLFAGHIEYAAPETSARRPNMARLVFLDGHVRDLYANWPAKARAVVGSLQIVVGANPDDELLHALVGELTAKSPEFADLWADHQIKRTNAETFEMRHPLVGLVTVIQQTLANGTDQKVVIATTEPGSPSRAALGLLAQALGPAPNGPTARAGTG